MGCGPAAADHILSSTILAEENKGQSTAPPTCELSATKDLYRPILASKECHPGTPGTRRPTQPQECLPFTAAAIVGRKTEEKVFT